MPAISIIIPHLNQPEHLRRCLASFKAQSFDMGQAEIVVVDNGSRVAPDDVCREFDGVRLEEEATPGPGPARNRGIEAARGRVLAFIDADCIADPGWLAAIAAAMEEGREVIGGDVRIAVADPSRLTMLEAYESIFAYRQQEYIEKQGFSGTGNLAMRREVHDAVGPFAGIEIAEDRDWGHRATAMGYRIAYVPEMIVFHPARQTMAELCAKWDRHVAHDFAEQVHGPRGWLRWLGLTIAVALSPALEVVRIARSTRVETTRDRVAAMRALVMVRLYRAWRMVMQAAGATKSRPSVEWNRG